MDQPAPPSGGPAPGAPVLVSRPRLRTPLVLLLLTMGTTFLTAICHFHPEMVLGQSFSGPGSLMPLRRAAWANWEQGLIYAAALLSILMAHEMGHFVATVIYRIPASLPYFLPLPLLAGTLGAVIAMDGRQADRRQIFDIGIAGPLAGLVIALPVMWAGVQQLDFATPRALGGMELDVPLLARWMMQLHDPATSSEPVFIGHMQGNPLFMAGWFGLLITGLNMMPVSQLDGGHVIHSLFGLRARLIARSFIACAVVYLLLAPNPEAPGFTARTNGWWLMLVLILLIGPDHPPTRDDTVDIGWFRRSLGFASLTIPVLCFPLRGIILWTPNLG